ncbi:unnamed protein product [Cunninghamella echinulata]
MDSTVLIVGAGPTGLFTALLLSQMGMDIRIIDKTKRNQELSQIPNYSLPLLLPLRSSTYYENTTYNNVLTQHSSISLLSPRVLQLLKLIGLYEQILEHGEQHWKLQVLDNDNWYHDPLLSSIASHHSRTFKDNNGIGSQTYKLWENNSTEINFCVSIDRKRLCQLLETALIKRYGIQVDYGYELVNMYDQNEKSQVLYMEDESNTDFYQGGFDKNNASPSSKNDGFTPIISALRHSEHHQNIQVWQSQYLIAADGKSSTVRQKLGLTQESGTTTKTNLTRKSTLSSLQRKPNQHQYFYSIIAKVKSNFNEKKQISIVVKPEGTLFILVHHDVFSMVFQPNNINPNESLSLLKTQLIIKRILKPYDLEFIETYNYFYWKDLTYPINKTNQVDYRYFLLGGTTLNAFPPGWVSSDIGLDQAMNLCWKLNLYHQEKSSPKLLDTYSSESYIKSKDITMASSLLLQILSTPSMLKDSITALQLFQKHRRYFVGEMVLDTTSQQFGNHSSSQTLKMARGTVGTLAPNALLKPYTLKQLKSQRSQENRFNYHQLQSLNSLSSYYQDQQGQEQVQEKTKQQKLGFFRGILSFSKKQNHHQSSSLSKKKSSPSLLSQFSSTTTTTTLSSTSSLSSPMDDKWKSIRNNTTNLWQHLPLHKNQFRSHFTILIVCHSLYNQDMIDSLQQLNHYLLNDPTSFLQLFDPSTNYLKQDDNNDNNNNMNRFSSTTAATANQSLFSYYSTPPLQQQKDYGPRKSMSTPTRTTTALEKEEEEEDENINNTIDIEGLGSSFLPPTLPPVVPLPPLPSTLASDSLFSSITSPKEKNKSSEHLLEQQQQRKNSITSFYSALTNINNEEQNDDDNSEDDEDDMDMIKNMDININDDESAIINFDDEENDDSDIENNNNNSNRMLAIPNHPSNQKQRYSNGVSLKSYRSSTFTNTTSRFSSYSDAFSLATTLSTSGSTLQLGMDDMKHNSILPPPKCPLPPPPPPSTHSTTSLQQRQQRQQQIPTSSTTSFHSSQFNNVYTHNEGQQNSYYSIAKKSMLSNSSNLTMTTYNKNDDDKEGEEEKKKIPMFSFTYLTTSNKPECLQFLAEQTPNTIQSTFPFGLENVHMDHENQAHSIYSLDNYQPTMVVIRPDGYIGAKVPLDDVNALNSYFHQFLLQDMHFSPEESAISLVANGYI